MKILQNSLLLLFCFLFAGCWIKFGADLADKNLKKDETNISLPASDGKNTTATAEKVVKIQGEYTFEFENLAQKFRQNNALAVRFFGDSHIASDDLLAGFRREFFETKPQNAVGFVYAAMPKYHKNGFVSYQISDFEILNSQRDKFDDYPLCGVVARAQKKDATITLKTQNLDDTQWEFEIFFRASKSGDALAIDAPNFSKIIGAKKGWQSARMRLKMPAKITALQDGLIIGGYRIFTREARYADHCGINGATSGIWRKWQEDAFGRLQSQKYDLIVLEYGTNDIFDPNFSEIKFRRNLSEFIQKIRQNLPDTPILILSFPPVDKPNFSVAQSVLKEVANSQKAWFYDIDAFVRENGGKRAWIEQNLSKTDVHLTPDGYKKIGQAIGRQLKNMLKSQP